MKLLSKGIRGVLGLFGLVLVAQGFLWGFFPAGNMAANGIVATGALGMNMIKSDIGGPLMVAGVFLVLAAIRRGRWVAPAIMIAAAYLGVRAVSLLVDGYSTMAMVGVVIEALVVVMLVAVRGQHDEDSKASASAAGEQ